jgi:hypothetical protein
MTNITCIPKNQVTNLIYKQIIVFFHEHKMLTALYISVKQDFFYYSLT